MSERINPIGLKGKEINERMIQLMGIKPLVENNDRSEVELTKVGPDGNVYGVVRENHEYYIKIASKKGNLLAEDFAYIGGLKNKKSNAYPSYAKALKQLNLKFISLNEALDTTTEINVFLSDNLQEGMGGYYDAEGPALNTESEEEVKESEDTEEELTEIEKAVEEMTNIEDKKIPVKERKLSIARAINDMGGIIDAIVNETHKKKVYTIK